VRLHLLYAGKPRDAHANGMAEDFLKRTRRFARCDMREIDPKKFDPWERHPSAFKIMLDPAGRTMDSAQFAAWLGKLEDKGREVVFFVGAHDGVPPAWRRRADLLLSLSAMTWPHELARVMLAEQLYRAFTTLRGHPYPR
jgi:23S rRNA (pseudouridine1915-N3)-methyltransferase